MFLLLPTRQVPPVPVQRQDVRPLLLLGEARAVGDGASGYRLAFHPNAHQLKPLPHQVEPARQVAVFSGRPREVRERRGEGLLFHRPSPGET